MPLVVPTNITALQGITPPSTSSPENFDPRADAFLGALPTLQNQINTIAGETNTNASYANEKATEAETSAAAALVSQNAANASALSAAQSAGAAMWVSGSYTTGAVAWSPLNGLVYRRKSPGGASPTDPSLDPTKWFVAIMAGMPYLPVTAGSSTATLNIEHALTGFEITQELILPPPTGYVGGEILAVRVANGLDTNYVTFGGYKGNGAVLSDDRLVLDDPFASITFRWVDATYGWSF